MDYCFDDKIDVKLITLFIIENFRMPVPNSYLVDIIMLNPIINYFDLENHIAELFDEGFVTYYTEDCDRFYSLTDKGQEALKFFSSRIPKTVRERLLRTIKLKVKELKNELSIKADYEKISDIEYKVTLGIIEGASELFCVSIAVGDEIMAKKMCASFRHDPEALYSEILSALIKDNSI